MHYVLQLVYAVWMDFK